MGRDQRAAERERRTAERWARYAREGGLKVAPVPLCQCGAEAVIGVYEWRGNRYFCEAHRDQAEA